MEFTHKPVLLAECIEALHIRPEGIYVDGTLGRAGHSREIAQRLTTGRLVCIDRDQAAIDAAKAKLESGELHVFDCSTFTVKGETLTSSMADVNTDPNYTPDTEAIVDGYFAESTFRSAPYFDLQIDGINLLDTNFGG